MPFLDFDALKKAVTFEQAIGLLALQVKRHSGTQWRGACPSCKTGGDRALVITEGKGFFCFAERAGGDVIALVAHVRDCSAKDAAAFLVGIVQGNSTVHSSERKSTVPESAAGNEPKKFSPLPYLESEHIAVDAIGFSAEFARKHGIGYAPRGTMRGYVLVPFRDDLGNLLGYIGVTPDCKLPADFTTNVVTFPKSA